MTRILTGYTLYWEAMSGAMAVEILLAEMGLDHRTVAVDMAAGEHRQARYLALNPSGQVPALGLPDGEILGESAAIVIALGERHPESPLVPGAGSPERSRFLRWLIYMAASPYMSFVQFNHPERFLEDPATHPALVDNARQRILGQFTLLDQAISGRPFFLEGGISALDFYLYMLVEFFGRNDLAFAGRDRLARLHHAVAGREVVRQVRRRHGP